MQKLVQNPMCIGQYIYIMWVKIKFSEATNIVLLIRDTERERKKEEGKITLSKLFVEEKT